MTTPSMGEELIRLAGVSRIFRTEEVETRALSDITMTVRTGEYVTVSGPSGCGKTTLLSVLGLLDGPTEGEYWLADRSVARLSRAERAQVRLTSIGFIFQAFNLLGDLTVLENVELPLTYRSLTPGERRVRAVAALERVQLGHRMRHYPAQLSGGQQQRVAVARAVAGDPVVLLADEPTGNLDSANGDHIMHLLKQLHQSGSTICMVTHDPRYAGDADRSIELFDGRLVSSGGV